jgi:hypothetical protein
MKNMEKLFPKSIKTRQDRIAWLVKNKEFVIASKKAAIKHADAVSMRPVFIGGDGEVVKSLDRLLNLSKPEGKLKVRAVINTTKLMDSHQDVHIDQLWNKSLKENKRNYLVKEHQLTFDGVISDDVHAFVKQMSWAELGFNYPGYTQALIFDAVLTRDQAKDMYDRYLNGKVYNHSVGMRYVKVVLAVNNPEYPEYENWEKYYPLIVNQEEADEYGYFYAVTEAKLIEGSAVVVGSNYATPTLSIEEKSEPLKDTRTEPMQITPQLLVNFYQPKNYIV